MKCPKCKTNKWMENIDGENIVCYKCESYWELQKDPKDNLPKCPQCDTDVDTIYPQDDKRLAKFDCGHVIMKNNL